MLNTRPKSTRRFEWHKVALAMGVIALLPMLSPASPVRGALHAQPRLLEWAAARPDGALGVIVQKTVPDNSVEELVAHLGGTVTADLSIINAFAAKVPASAVEDLARAEGVRWVSLDAVVKSAACGQCVDTSELATAYIGAIRADQVWNSAPHLQGEGIGVAVLDSGINPNGDLSTASGADRVIANVRFNTDGNQTVTDGYGHGTLVASLVGGDGSDSGGKYIGVAPRVNIINVKVNNDDGSSTVKSVVQGMEWVLKNKKKYNIRVVNLSQNSTVAESYRTNPLDAAAEILWFNQIVVVASAGNAGKGAIFPPANDPFVISVGATNDLGTRALADDAMASFSSYGATTDGFAKPDLVAPGKNIVGRLVNPNLGMAKAHPANVIAGLYFSISGTSASAPIVSGAVALLLQSNPKLTPDQVKYRLMATANKNWSGYNAAAAGAGYLDIYAAVRANSLASANTGLLPSKWLWTGRTPVTWNSVNWDSVNWDSVNWDSVNWDSVNWDSVNWDSDYWGP